MEVGLYNSPIIRETTMPRLLLLLLAALALAGCSATAPAYGIVGDEDDLYTGTATGYADRTGKIELKNTNGNRCTGDFVRGDTDRHGAAHDSTSARSACVVDAVEPTVSRCRSWFAWQRHSEGP